MVALNGELGEPPARVVDLWGLDELRGITLDGGAGRPGRADDVHARSAARRSAASISPGWSRRPRRSGRPRSRTAARSVGTPPMPRRPATRCRSCSPSMRVRARERPRRARRPGRRVLAGLPATALAPDELILRIRVPFAPGREVRFRKVGTRRAQSISKVVMALAWLDGADGAAWRPRPPRPRIRCGDPDPGRRDRGGPRGPPADARDRRPRRRDARGRAPSHRRRPIHRRVPARRRRAGPPSTHPRGRWLVSAGSSPCRVRPAKAPPPIDVLDVLSPGTFAASMAPLFEGAPRFLGRLAMARPFDSMERSWAEARRSAIRCRDPNRSNSSTPTRGSERHPGACRRSRSTSRVRPWRRRRPGGGVRPPERGYEARFGFRYCVFVAGRSRAALLPDFESAIEPTGTRSSREPSTRSSTSPTTGMPDWPPTPRPATGRWHRDRAPCEPLWEGGHPPGPRRSRHDPAPAPGPMSPSRSKATSPPPTRTATTRTSSPPTR